MLQNRAARLRGRRLAGRRELDQRTAHGPPADHHRDGLHHGRRRCARRRYGAAARYWTLLAACARDEGVASGPAAEPPPLRWPADADGPIWLRCSCGLSPCPGSVHGERAAPRWRVSCGASAAHSAISLGAVFSAAIARATRAGIVVSGWRRPRRARGSGTRAKHCSMSGRGAGRRSSGVGSGHDGARAGTGSSRSMVTRHLNGPQFLCPPVKLLP